MKFLSGLLKNAKEIFKKVKKICSRNGLRNSCESAGRVFEKVAPT